MTFGWRFWAGSFLALLIAVPAPATAADDALFRATFLASDADPSASVALGNQKAFLDRRTPSRGQLVVFLHGSGVAENCGPTTHLKLLAGFGFHVLSPCYVADYGVENCGDAIAACRLEAFDGVDRHPAIAIQPADSIEQRISNGLRHLEEVDPGHGWITFLAEDGRPDWEKIVLTGHSHGASTAALIGKTHDVQRIVLLSGPYDVGQAWLEEPGMTAAERQFGLTHSADKQHAGHLAAFAALGLPGPEVDVDQVPPPYEQSHRLVTGVTSEKPHSAVYAGKMSPETDGVFVLEPVWRYLYGADDPVALLSSD